MGWFGAVANENTRLPLNKKGLQGRLRLAGSTTSCFSAGMVEGCNPARLPDGLLAGVHVDSGFCRNDSLINIMKRIHCIAFGAEESKLFNSDDSWPLDCVTSRPKAPRTSADWKLQ